MHLNLLVLKKFNFRIPRKRDFALERKFLRDRLEDVIEHPLKPLMGPVRSLVKQEN